MIGDDDKNQTGSEETQQDTTGTETAKAGNGENTQDNPPAADEEE